MGDLVEYQEWDDDKAAEDFDEALGGKTPYWKPKEGRNVIRFLPALKGWSHGPLLSVAEHFINGPDKLIVFPCPRMLAKEDCPACERANELYSSGNKKDKDVGFSWFARKQHVANIIDRKDPDKGPQRFKFGKMVAKGLRDIREDPDTGGDFTHPEKGYDIIIKRTGTGKTDTRYTVLPGKRGPLGNMDWIKQQPAHQLPRLLTPDQVLARLQGETIDDFEEVKQLPPGEKKSKKSKKTESADDMLWDEIEDD